MQHDAHVRAARAVRTVFYAEIEPGSGVEIQANRCVPYDKLAWAVLRIVEGKRMEMDGSWRADLARLEAALAARNIAT